MSILYQTKIAGINYHLSINNSSCIGVVQGYCMADPNNTYNTNAIAIYTDKNKLIGYIAEDELEDFAEWSENKVLKFIGIVAPFYNEDDEPMLFGRVTFCKGDDNEKVVDTLYQLRIDYKKELEQLIQDFNHRKRNIEDMETLRNTNSTNTKNNNSNSGCLGIIIFGLCIITAMFL